MQHNSSNTSNTRMTHHTPVINAGGHGLPASSISSSSSSLSSNPLVRAHTSIPSHLPSEMDTSDNDEDKNLSNASDPFTDLLLSIDESSSSLLSSRQDEFDQQLEELESVMMMGSTFQSIGEHSQNTSQHASQEQCWQQCWDTLSSYISACRQSAAGILNQFRSCESELESIQQKIQEIKPVTDEIAYKLHDDACRNAHLQQLIDFESRKHSEWSSTHDVQQVKATFDQLTEELTAAKNKLEELRELSNNLAVKVEQYQDNPAQVKEAMVNAVKNSQTQLTTLHRRLELANKQGQDLAATEKALDIVSKKANCHACAKEGNARKK